MSTSYQCPVCGHEVENNMIAYMQHVKSEIIDEIKRKTPGWNPEKGICPKCKEHFTNWFDQLN